MSVVKLIASFGSSSVAARLLLIASDLPPGVVSISVLTSGDSIPNRGSGPGAQLRTRPSGSVVVTALPAPPIDVPASPLGSATVRCGIRVESLPTWYAVDRPSAVVTVPP